MVFLYHCLIVEDFDFYNLRIDLSRMAGIGKSDGFRFHKSVRVGYGNPLYWRFKVGPNRLLDRVGNLNVV